MKVNISVIIPTMNRPESLRCTLNHIIAGECIPSQIIVVDQSQNENMQLSNQSVVKQYICKLEGLEYYYQSIPSLTKARNYGFSFAKNEIVVFSDDDVDVRKDTFSNVIELFSDKKLAMAGGVNEDNGSPQASTLSCIFGMASFRKRNIGHMARACYGRFPSYCDNETPTEWTMGFFFVVRRSLMIRWNKYFDENLKSYAYAEDLDFSYGYYKKALAEGFFCIMSKKLVVKHNVSKEYRIPKRNHIFMLVLHRYYISKKYSLPFYEIHNLWSNFGLFLLKLFKHEMPKDLFDAQLFYYKHRKDILKGNFLSEKW